jgi:hypothetical protein
LKLTKDRQAVASRFESLMNHEAWKLLEKMADEQRESSMKDQDNKNAQDLNINVVCEARGFRKGIRWVFDQVRTKAEIG